VELTPQSNDRGVDIFAHQKGAKVLVDGTRLKELIWKQGRNEGK
jgi:hypothetical protein